ncbi:MAG: ribonuclease H-like domain-containing protein [Methanomassiliicoccales archaeon]|nr:ribonuclease H-like domain-containing protein [Methanomassiliicoccales archaeon]MDD1756689.1 ribonuclease H-like domain-containing protein [Methanomassiliicoccales archaeon]
MIRRTFLILPSVGAKTERELWGKGVARWEDFQDRPHLPGFSASRKGRLDQLLVAAEDFLERRETGYFHRLLPPSEHWRLFGEVKEDAAYLDIETDGLGEGAVVTVVGVHRQGRDTTLVRGIDLDARALRQALQGCRILVTFNGSSFDLPMLEREFPFAVPRVPHFDLRHGCARIGLKGGLKSIEKQLGMSRPLEVEYVTGEEAVYLWRLWERKGKENALKLLKQYNREDTKNLVPIAEMTYYDLVTRTLAKACSPTP